MIVVSQVTMTRFTIIAKTRNMVGMEMSFGLVMKAEETDVI